MHTTATNDELFDIRCDYTGELISQHPSRTEAEDALSRIDYAFAQDLTIWKHLKGAADDSYLNLPPEFRSPRT